ncbi:hypothetical protein [Aggregatilinea lenta]|uniref:hypothetical protein n=1 Tax=Aggregatilinea lenta TaxID=913108 RepID=UPI000E5B4721|nr:hypothetical protein [Aggregatilinea lenta]
MITEQDIVRNLTGILAGEHKALHSAIRMAFRMHPALTQLDIDELTYRLRFYLRALHPQANELVDQWVSEVAEPVSHGDRIIWRPM